MDLTTSLNEEAQGRVSLLSHKANTTELGVMNAIFILGASLLEAYFAMNVPYFTFFRYQVEETLDSARKEHPK